MNQIIRLPWLITLAVTVFGWVWVMAGERAVTQSQLGEFHRELDAIQKHADKADDQLNRIQRSVIAVQTDVKWIRLELGRLHKDQRSESHP